MIRLPAFAALFALVGASSALAADYEAPVEAAPAAEGWIVTLKANARVSAAWEGADEYSVIAYPSIGFRRAGEPETWSAPDDGASIAIIDTGRLRLGPVAGFVGGRDADDDALLAGLDEVDWTIEAGIFADLWVTEWLRAHAELRRGFHGHEGFVADLGLDFVQHWDQWTFAIGPRASLGDDEFMDTTFGITPVEAARNGVLPAYDPSGGVKSVGLAGSVTYRWNEQWTTTLSAGYDRLVGDAADSPIVTEVGSENQFSVGLTVGYSFAWGGLGR